jgi:hypothetical protein
MTCCSVSERAANNPAMTNPQTSAKRIARATFQRIDNVMGSVMRDL